MSNVLATLPEGIRVEWYTDDVKALRSGRPPLCESNSVAAAAFDADRIVVKRPPTLRDGEALTQFHYNQLRLSPEFHESLNARHVLFFESDTVLCSGATFGFDHWLGITNVSYIGAPWPGGGRLEWCATDEPCCCNAGLSLVDVDAFVRLMRSKALQRETASGQIDLTHRTSVDAAQCDMLYLDLKARNELGAFQIADPALGADFSVEAFGPRRGVVPFGVHKPWWALNEYPRDLEHLARICPEVALLCPYARSALKNTNKRHDSAPFLAAVCDHTPAAIEHHRTNGAPLHHFERGH